MPNPKKSDEAALLADRMLEFLNTERSLGGDRYPPTLQHLGELCDGSPSHELIVKAAGKKAFTDKAVAIKKVNKKPALDSLVYFKEDVPTPKVLAIRMLDALNAQRSFGGDRYPPTLQHLGELCDGSPSQELIVKAAATKEFTDKAVAIKKVNKKPALDSPVYFTEDVKPEEEVLAARMLAVLEGQQRLGASAYPPTLRRLAELCEVNGSDARVTKAASHAILSNRAVVVAKNGKKPSLDAPVVLKEDLERGFESVLPALLRFALRPTTSKSKGKTIETAGFSPSDLKKRFIVEMQGRFNEAIERGVAHRGLPLDVAWLLVKGNPILFLMENLQSGTPPTVVRGGRMISTPVDRTATRRDRDFASAFLEAFDELDRRNGSTNFVKLADLRDALSEFSREEFDAGLRQLRLDRVFSLDSHEGLHGSLTHEEREAGVREAGSLLIYASRS
jgi:hypothetical protein